MIRTATCISLPLFSLALTACTATGNPQANSLLWQATRHAEEMMEPRSYRHSLEEYEAADEYISSLLSQYPSSSVVDSLRLGKAEIAGISLVEFFRLRSKLEVLAEAEREPVALARTFAEVQPLVLIARTYSKADQPCRARVALSAALDLLRKTDGAESSRDYLSEVARRLAELGDCIAAHEALGLLLERVSSVEYMLHKASVGARCGGKEEALQLLEKVEDQLVEAPSSDMDDPLAELVREYLHHNLADQAESSAQKIASVRSRFLALRRIAIAHARAEKGSEFLRTAASMRSTAISGDPEHALNWLLHSWFQKCLELGQREEARRVLLLIRDQALSQDSDFDRTRILSRVVDGLLDLGETDAARGLLIELRNTPLAPEAGAHGRVRALGFIAAAYHRLLEADLVEAYLEKARTEMQNAHGHPAESARRVMAYAYAGVGRFESALQTLDLVQEARDRAGALGRLGQMNWEAGRTAEARALYEEMIELAQEMEDTRDAASLLQYSTSLCAAAGMLDLAVKAVTSIQEPRALNHALILIPFPCYGVCIDRPVATEEDLRRTMTYFVFALHAVNPLGLPWESKLTGYAIPD